MSVKGNVQFLDQDFEIQKRHVENFTEKNQTFLREDHLDGRPLYQKINWLNAVIVFGVPALAFFGTYKHWNEISGYSWIFAVIYYFVTGFGITAGYHRYWSHMSYEINKSLEWMLMFAATGALQGSIKWWCLLHRAHHRWTDTNKDPYNAQRGFFYAHIGWLLYDNIRVSGHVEMSDLRSNKIVRWQHKHFPWLGPFMAFVFPTLMCYFLFNDWKGGFYVAGTLRLLFVHHATWCVNSVAHFWGDKKFDDTISPRDSIITGLLTLGEGYHNFHHEFPHDYRNGIRWYDYDPTKWLINIFYYIGFVKHLSVFPKNEILRGEYEMKIKKIKCEMDKKIDHGIKINKLPLWNKNDIDNYIQKTKNIVVILNHVVFDVTYFVKKTGHPGGKKIILERNGKDVSRDFNGEVYNHTNAARNLLAHMPIARYIENYSKENHHNNKKID